MRQFLPAVLTLGVLTAARPAHAQTTYELTVRGAECKQNTGGDLYCVYKVGRDLEFSIAGVGTPDAGISFLKSSFAGDFYARFGIQHGCVIVAAGEKAPGPATAVGSDFAFVSPANGRVYRTWQECAKTRS
jgi:hypothetical protein